MIRVRRGPEPMEMRLIRRRCLAAAIVAKGSGKQVAFDGYAEMKNLLVDKLNYKCVYCEVGLRMEGNPVEHFRPKACVHNEGEPRDSNRYWWLAWTWENLFFACGRCNTHRKQNQFPLEPQTAPLQPRDFDLQKEKPLLLDPAQDEPRDHLRFKWSDERKKWRPIAVRNSARGKKTIAILGLDEDDHARAHVEEVVTPWVEQIRAMENGDQNALRTTWERALRSLFAPRREFHALAWDVLDAAFPASFRQKHQLALPVLAQTPQPYLPSVEFDPADDPPEFVHLPEDLKLRVRAIPLAAKMRPSSSSSQGDGDAHQVLEAVRALRKWTDAELASLFGREESTVKNWIRPHS